MLPTALHDPDLRADRVGDIGDRRRPGARRSDELEVLARAGRVDRAAAQEQAAQHRLPVARGIRDGARGGLGEGRGKAWRQRELDEERHPLARLDRLVLGFQWSDRAAKAYHLARDRVAQEREVGRLSGFTRSLDQATTRTEIDPQQLAQLTAGSCRQKPGHLVLDVRRERNPAYLPD